MAKRRKYALSDSSDSSSVEIIQNNDLSLDNQPILGEYCLVKIIPSNKRRCPQFHYKNVFSGKLTVLPFKSWGKEAIYLKCECSIKKLCKFSATIEPNSAICENYIHKGEKRNRIKTKFRDDIGDNIFISWAIFHI